MPEEDLDLLFMKINKCLIVGHVYVYQQSIYW